MNQTPRARRLSGVPAALMVLMVAVPAAAQPDSPYEIVLRDGTSVAAATRPLIAMGKVSFLDAGHRSMTLDVQVVDIEATRSQLGSPASSSRRWTERSIAKVKGNIQIVGESEAPAEMTGEAPTEVASADTVVSTDAQKILAEIEAIDVKVKPLGPTDRQRTILLLHQLELRQELNRILRPSASS